jgi:hypothetical protein
MATLENKILGDVGGRIGNLVGRRRKGKYFIYEMPEQIKVSNSAEAKKARALLGTASKFGSIVNKIPELKNIWRNRPNETFDAFHKIEKENFKFIIPERPTIMNFITPGGSAGSPIMESNISSRGIKLKIIITEAVLGQFEGAKELCGIGVLCFFNPEDNGKPYFELSKIRADGIAVKIEELFEVDIPFYEVERNNFKSNRNSILYFTFIAKSAEGVPIIWSENYRNEFTHEYSTDERERFLVCDSRA